MMLQRWLVFVLIILCADLALDAADRPVRVQVDCREGVGLLPNMWRGLGLQSGEIPDGVDLRTVCLGPEPVAHAWTMRRRGGEYDWRHLDIALAELKVRDIDVVLVLPVPKTKDALWTELVTQTVRHVGGRVSLFEFRADPDADLEMYLDFYEAGAWAAYQVSMDVRVGGPGLSWQDAGVAALLKRCAEFKLPMHAVTWRVDVQAAEDVKRSVDAVTALIDRYPLDRRPERLVTGWRVADVGMGDSLAVGLSALMSVMTSDARAVCLGDTTDLVGWTAMHALNQMTGVRVPVVIQAPDGGISGVAHLEDDTVLAVFWHARPDGVAPVTASFSGLPWGDRIRIEQLRISTDGHMLTPAALETRVFREPVVVTFPLVGGTATAIRLVVE